MGYWIKLKNNKIQNLNETKKECDLIILFTNNIKSYGY